MQPNKSAYFSLTVPSVMDISLRVHQQLDRMGQMVDPNYKYSAVEFHLYEKTDKPSPFSPLI